MMQADSDGSMTSFHFIMRIATQMVLMHVAAIWQGSQQLLAHHSVPRIIRVTTIQQDPTVPMASWLLKQLSSNRTRSQVVEQQTVKSAPCMNANSSTTKSQSWCWRPIHRTATHSHSKRLSGRGSSKKFPSPALAIGNAQVVKIETKPWATMMNRVYWSWWSMDRL